MTRQQIIAVLEQLPPDQLIVVSEFIQFLQSKTDVKGGKRKTLPNAIGLLATGQRPPSDAEVQHWLNERRDEKYG